MLLPDLRTAAIACLAGVVIGALPAWYFTAEYKDSQWGKAVSDQKVEAAKVLQAETDKVLVAERAANQFKDKLEKQNAESQKRIDATLADNRRLARELGGLRDPGRRPSGSCTSAGTSDASGVDSGATAEGRLSVEASEFLLEFAAEADRVAEYAMTCHLWATGQKAGKP